MTSDRRTAWWIGCGGGTAAGFVVHGLIVLTTGTTEPGPDPRATVRASTADAPPFAAASRAFVDADVVRRLTEEIAALRDQLDVATSGAVDRTIAAAPAPVLDETMLVAALRRARDLEEEERFAVLNDAELYAEADRLLRANKMDRLGSRRMLRALLARPSAATSPDLRANALMLLAQVFRDLNDFSAAASALQRVVDDFGLASERGAQAGNQLALLAASTKDYPAGIALAEQVARTAPVPLAFEARWGIGFLQRSSGDVTTARATLQQLIRDCAGRPEVEYVAKMCERTLATMGQ